MNDEQLRLFDPATLDASASVHDGANDRLAEVITLRERDETVPPRPAEPGRYLRAA